MVLDIDALASRAYEEILEKSTGVRCDLGHTSYESSGTSSGSGNETSTGSPEMQRLLCMVQELVDGQATVLDNLRVVAGDQHRLASCLETFAGANQPNMFKTSPKIDFFGEETLFVRNSAGGANQPDMRKTSAKIDMFGEDMLAARNSVGGDGRHDMRKTGANRDLFREDALRVRSSRGGAAASPLSTRCVGQQGLGKTSIRSVIFEEETLCIRNSIGGDLETTADSGTPPSPRSPRLSLPGPTPRATSKTSCCASSAPGMRRRRMDSGTWPGSLQVRDYSFGENDEDQAFLEAALSLGGAGIQGDEVAKRIAEGTQYDGRWVMDPTSPTRLLFDVAALCMLLWDSITAPLTICFNLELEGIWLLAVYVNCVVWSADICFNFRTAYYVSGELEMCPKKIAVRYLRTFFLIDVTLVALDVVSLVARHTGGASSDSGDEAAMKIFRSVKATRLLRLVGVLRMARTAEKLERLCDLLGITIWGGLGVTMEVLRILGAIIWINHLIACVFYALGTGSATDTGLHWLERTVPGDADYSYMDAGLFFQYMTAFHWSLTQLTPGSMEVTPANSVERMFNCACLLFGMVIFGSLVSLLSSKAVAIRQGLADTRKKMATMERYLTRKKIDHSLALAIQKHLSEKLTVSTPSLADPATLSLLSLSLRSKLHWELCRPQLIFHPMFRVLYHLDHLGAKQMADESVQFYMCPKLDTLFMDGTEASAAYILSEGEIKYWQDGVENFAQSLDASRALTLDLSAIEPDETSAGSPTATVDKGAWLAEAALFLQWTHVGTAEFTMLSEIMSINIESFAKHAKSRVSFRQSLKRYAMAFHARVSESSPENFPSDIAVPNASFEDLIGGLPAGFRSLVGALALRVLKRSMPNMLGGRRQHSYGKIVQLEKEVMKGSSVLFFTPTGGVQRVVVLSALRLRDAEGRIFAQLGKWQDCSVVGACQLPGSKNQEGETPQGALQRLLDGFLRDFRDGLALGDTERKVDVRTSARYAVPTKYIRTETKAQLLDDFVLPDLPSVQIIADFNRLAKVKLESPAVASRTTMAIESAFLKLRSSLGGEQGGSTPLNVVFLRGMRENEFLLHAWLPPWVFQALTRPSNEATQCLEDILSKIRLAELPALNHQVAEVPLDV